MSEVSVVRVFVREGQGGNPVPLVADAQAMTGADMQAIAAAYGHESAFVLPAGGDADWRLRFFVPQHEMEMCGHATVGTLWAMRQWGHWTTPTARIETLSGMVHAYWDDRAQCAWISQPAVQLQTLDDTARRRVQAQLGLPPGAYPAINASTSRVKTLVALPSVSMLDGLQPDFPTMEALCTSIGSTGLYPYAMGETDAEGRPVVHARQFPRSSGYQEDAATGIAAAALWGYLASQGMLGGPPPASIAVWQGDAMGSPSEILVAPRSEGARIDGCWLSGASTWSEQ
ncbi:PhzF family phenazine biosynthesis protein [Cupriavidus respiraculi]|uniref:PhzF family phenazine biosynthesis protein n=1 Tax=Cupriavidus respiraculi TaxID=195930 RepID=UPI002D7EF5A8|nr:PhzF family phenazine biosynthesis protein [Cupriavidus respiraculi]